MERRAFLRQVAVGAAGLALPETGKEIVDGRLSQKVTLAFKATALSDLCDHFNVGTGRQVSTNQIFHLVRTKSGVHAPEVHGPARAGDQRTSALDSSLIAAKLGWRPQIALEDGLDGTVAWFRQRADKARRHA